MASIHRIFIANRGEIARRIALSARKLGIQSACIQESEVAPRFLSTAVDCLIPLAGATTADYLDINKMLHLAQKSECDAIHPGFGFLSENSEFARACIEHGLVWIGPRPEAIEAMASKAHARSIAIKAGVPCLLALDGLDIDSDPQWQKKLQDYAAKNPAFPMIVKAAYGGGGKGMRLAHSASELEQQCQRASAEAKSSFGNGLLVVEPYVTQPRHVEVQILGDQHGQMFSIGDRDCSVQRRHQKIIEEAPAPDLSEELRQKMAATSRQLGSEVGYDSAGTVEFLVDWSEEGRAQQRFYFLEMNTRLQVEHPVTEEVFGIDLVEQQIRAARGERLDLHQDQLKARGHSIEMRLYAEDCAQDFMPSPGPVYWFESAQMPSLRNELGLDRHDRISGSFDPMVGKIIASASDRPQAISRLREAIKQSVFIGTQNNLCYIRCILEDADFSKGAVATSFVLEKSKFLMQRMNELHQQHQELADLILDQIEAGAIDSLNSMEHGGSKGLDETFKTVFMQKGSLPAGAEAPKGDSAATVFWQQYFQNTFENNTPITYGYGYFSYQGTSKGFTFLRARTLDKKVDFVQIEDQVYSRTHLFEGLLRGASASSDGDLSAPVPGKVTQIQAEPEATYETGTCLLVLESMKMQFEIKAPNRGRIKAILVEVGQQVDAGTALISWEEQSDN